MNSNICTNCYKGTAVAVATEQANRYWDDVQKYVRAYDATLDLGAQSPDDELETASMPGPQLAEVAGCYHPTENIAHRQVVCSRNVIERMLGICGAKPVDVSSEIQPSNSLQTS